ncbi:MAG TPA: glycosyltransferase 87 family protein [Gemmatimonadaceae bacterium]|nr:glycosyltransferase 87 family protein [Gemmatimonadaceae bacterium]
MVGIYVASAGLVTIQRGILGPAHTTFRIFRWSFWHLLRGVNLYAPYPTQQGGAPADLFKYSPTAALLFAPFALPSYAVGLFAWSLLGALLLYHALQRVLPPRQAVLASVLVYPDLLSSMQACSSNALVAALIILAFAALEHEQRVRAALAIAAGAAIKLFPLAALSFAVFHARRRRFAFAFAAVAVAAVLLPLLVTTPARLAGQYHWWMQIERGDAGDLLFGLSVMRLVRGVIGGTWPNWPVQLAGTVVLLLPLALGHRRWTHPVFRLQYLSSLLAYAVLFNHQAERASFVIASAGVAIWCVAPPPGSGWRTPRLLLGMLALFGLGPLPLAVVWIAMQAELLPHPSPPHPWSHHDLLRRDPPRAPAAGADRGMASDEAGLPLRDRTRVERRGAPHE